MSDGAIRIGAAALNALVALGVEPSQSEWDAAIAADKAAEAVYRANNKHVAKRGEWFTVAL